MNWKMVLISALTTLLIIGCVPKPYELHSITPILISKDDPTLKIFREKVCRKLVVEESSKSQPPAGSQEDSTKQNSGESVSRRVKTKCKTTSDRDFGAWYLRRVYDQRMGKRLISTVEILWCDTGMHNYEKCRVAVAWSRNPTGGLGEEKNNDLSLHVVPEAETFRKVKWPDQHGVPGHSTRRKGPGAQKKPTKDLLQKKRLQETPVADEL